MNQRALVVLLFGGAFIPLTTALPLLSDLPLAVSFTQAALASSPLAPSLQGKPVLVVIYASWCTTCRKMKPVLKTIRQQEGNDVHWVQFDVSTSAASKRSAARAKELGLGQFFKSHRSQTSLVSILNPATGASIRTFRAQTEIDPYVSAIRTTRSLIRR